MDFVGGLRRKIKGHDYMFLVVDNFSKMFILIPCKRIIKGQHVSNMFFEKA
jgi:hypothetical protein